MAGVRFFKAVAALPATLAASALYAVRVGLGFDLYLTTSDGVAHKLNTASVRTFTNRAAFDAYVPTDPHEIAIYTGP
jgi:hypothetical protein